MTPVLVLLVGFQPAAGRCHFRDLSGVGEGWRSTSGSSGDGVSQAHSAGYQNLAGQPEARRQGGHCIARHCSGSMLRMQTNSSVPQTSFQRKLVFKMKQISLTLTQLPEGPKCVLHRRPTVWTFASAIRRAARRGCWRGGRHEDAKTCENEETQRHLESRQPELLLPKVKSRFKQSSRG